jgi:hypothetical protein
MRIILDLSGAPRDRIEGTASWADNGEPIAFSGWLALMRLIEDAQGRDDDTTTPTATDATVACPPVEMPADGLREA